jgi:chromosome segregation ATPase
MDFPRGEVDVDQLKEVIHQKNNELQIMQSRLQEAEIKIENLENEVEQPEELWKRHAKSFTWRSIPILLTAGILL